MRGCVRKGLLEIFKMPLGNNCPIELSKQLAIEGFNSLMGAKPPPAPKGPVAPGESSPGLDNACLSNVITCLPASSA